MQASLFRIFRGASLTTTTAAASLQQQQQQVPPRQRHCLDPLCSENCIKDLFIPGLIFSRIIFFISLTTTNVIVIQQQIQNNYV